jgi:hypothetical protein
MSLKSLSSSIMHYALILIFLARASKASAMLTTVGSNMHPFFSSTLALFHYAWTDICCPAAIPDIKANSHHARSTATSITQRQGDFCGAGEASAKGSPTSTACFSRNSAIRYVVSLTAGCLRGHVGGGTHAGTACACASPDAHHISGGRGGPGARAYGAGRKLRPVVADVPEYHHRGAIIIHLRGRTPCYSGHGR